MQYINLMLYKLISLETRKYMLFEIRYAYETINFQTSELEETRKIYNRSR